MNVFAPRGLIFILATMASVFLATSSPGAVSALTLSDPALTLKWASTEAGWALSNVSLGEKGIGLPGGGYTVLYSPSAPDQTPVHIATASHPEGFPPKEDKLISQSWQDATTAVGLNTAGQVFNFLPESAGQDGSIVEFSGRTEVADVTARWQLDPAAPGDVLVTLTLIARKDGWFSLSTPTLATLAPAELSWAMIPGYFQGDRLESDLVLAYGYGHGLPDRPVVVRERTASTLAPLMTNRRGITLAVVPEPGTAADPWEKDVSTRKTWRLGLSLMNRAGQLSPTLYAPVLGEVGSQLKQGEQRQLRFRYVLREGDWFSVVKYAARSVYRLSDFLAMKQPPRSLSARLVTLKDYVTDDKTSLWRTEQFAGVTLGAQAYLGAVTGSDKDAMKNSDYGAMWMLARMTNDPALIRDRLPFARNFKLVQQQTAPGFFQGAAVGQYYLSKSQRFTEEWGDYVEPVALTYYTILDLGNILLFNPEDAELRERLRLGADRLLSWQHADGRWEVAYDHKTHEALYRELPDYRPTFYGLLVAYRVLGDAKYLEGAKKGADWLLTNSIAQGRFLGVCGDTRFAPDFATAQIAQAMLDLYDLTNDQRYRDGGIAATRFYTASIYTHPLATTAVKQASGVPRQDWEINQSGLGFEHGGMFGSANRSGPILLASHAGLFVRVAKLTGDDFYLDLARAGAWARDAFVDPATNVASYYWSGMRRGPGSFPHHAWWQIGWITDYLISEAGFRSQGAIQFPRGFFTPKVGPHGSYGFAPGRIFGQAVNLQWGNVTTDQPQVDSLIARSTDGATTYAILLNNSTRPLASRVQIDSLTTRPIGGWSSVSLVDPQGRVQTLPTGAELTVSLPATGLAVLVLN